VFSRNVPTSSALASAVVSRVTFVIGVEFSESQIVISVDAVSAST
jgi:hypothetical protein